MKFKINKSIILVSYIFVSSSLFSQNNSLKREIITKVIDSIEAHNQLEFEMFRSERNEKNEFIDGKFYAKMNKVMGFNLGKSTFLRTISLSIVMANIEKNHREGGIYPRHLQQF
ncbi:hypothetical protein N9K77_01410 [bacterium]|nr:hypothetical protein [bacterium]